MTNVPSPDRRPEDERQALAQRLDFCRALASEKLSGLGWEQASERLLPATDMTIAGIVRHLAWVEDHWFQRRLLATEMPEPWRSRGIDSPDRAMRLDPDDTVEGIVELYAAACDRSRDALARAESLSEQAAAGSSRGGPVNLRWILVHMVEETSQHVGHLDLLHDALADR